MRFKSNMKWYVVIVLYILCIYQARASMAGHSAIKTEEIFTIVKHVIQLEYNILAEYRYRQRHNFARLLEEPANVVELFAKGDQAFNIVLSNMRIRRSVRKKTSSVYSVFTSLHKLYLKNNIKHSESHKSPVLEDMISVKSHSKGKDGVSAQRVLFQKEEDRTNLMLEVQRAALIAIVFLLLVVISYLKYIQYKVYQRVHSQSLIIRDLRKKIKLKKVAKYLPKMNNLSMYALIYTDLDGNIIAMNERCSKIFGKDILIGDNWDTFFQKYFSKSFTDFKEKMVFFQYEGNYKQVFALSSKQVQQDKSLYRVCEIIPFYISDLIKLSDFYGNRITDNRVDLEDMFENMCVLNASNHDVGDSLLSPKFRKSHQRFLHIGSDNVYKIVAQLNKISSAISAVFRSTEGENVNKDLNIYFDKYDNCIFELNFYKVNLKNIINNYFYFNGKKTTVKIILDEFNELLPHVGFSVSVVNKKDGDSFKSVIYLEVVDMFLYKAFEGKIDFTTNKVM